MKTKLSAVMMSSANNMQKKSAVAAESLPPEGAVHIFSFKDSSLKDFVLQKLTYTLKHGAHPPSDLLQKFYSPVEKALIQTALCWNSGRKMQTARQLGVHRNTLQSKMRFHNISLKDLMSRSHPMLQPIEEIHISSLEDMDLEAPAQKAFLFLKQEGALKEPLLEKLAQPVERAVAHTAYRHFKCRRGKTAKALGISASALKSKLTELEKA